MIILVRHGEATHHTQRLTGGWTDSQLTEKGADKGCCGKAGEGFCRT